MASTFYDWHSAKSQIRMKQQPLFDNGVQVEKYHHKQGLVLNFLAVISGKQISILLDKETTLAVRNQILAFYPTDKEQEIAALKQRIIDLENALEDYIETNQNT